MTANKTEKNEAQASQLQVEKPDTASDACEVSVLNRPSRIMPDIWAPAGMCIFMFSGIPAFLLLEIFNAAGLATILGLTAIESKQLFLLFYLLSAGGALVSTVIVSIMILNHLRILYGKPPRIRVDEHAIFLPASYQSTLKFKVQAIAPVNSSGSDSSSDLSPDAETGEDMAFLPKANRFLEQKLPWKYVKGIEYRFGGDVFREPRIRINVETAFGIASYDIDLLTLSQEDRKKLANALYEKAPAIAVRHSLSERMKASDAANCTYAKNDSEPSYTDLWLRSEAAREKGRIKLLFPGESIKEGRYRIIEALVSGGQSNVYLAETTDEGERKKVIVKEFILPADRSGWQAENAYLNEMDILNCTSFNGIVKFLDSFEESGRACLFLEYVEGSTLASFIEKQGALIEQDAIKLGLALAESIKYLHGLEHPVIHRDLSPHNIIIGKSAFESAGSLTPEQVTLIDFASAIQSQDASVKQEVTGTISYTAPEQFRGRASKQSDLYSLGATLFFAVTGLDPEPLTKLSPRKSKPALSPEFDSLVSTLTEQDCKERYKDIDEVMAELLTL